MTSPPFFGLRDYQTGSWAGGDPACDHIAGRGGNLANSIHSIRGGAKKMPDAQAIPFRDVCGKCGARREDAQIGLEPTPEEFVATMVQVFREVRRVLRDDGVAFLNLGDSYAGSGPSGASYQSRTTIEREGKASDGAFSVSKTLGQRGLTYAEKKPIPPPGLKHKDLIGVPHMVAFALRADGWYWRDTIAWSKAEVDEDDALEGGCMPGSQRDRCTSAHEYIFQLTKRPDYFFDLLGCPTQSGAPPRNVWRINTSPSKHRHFAAFPPELARRAILLGTSAKGCCPACKAPLRRLVERSRQTTRPGLDTKMGGVDLAALNGRPGGNVTGYRDARRHVTEARTIGWEPTCGCNAGPPVPCVVLDPFNGSGTTLAVAEGFGRRGIGLDINAEYLTMARRRIERPHAPSPRPRRPDPCPATLFDGLEADHVA